MHAMIRRIRFFPRSWLDRSLLALALASLALGNIQAAPVRYTSSVAKGDVFRDADGDRQLTDAERVATTGEDGIFILPKKGKGRIFIKGGFQIPGGGVNDLLLTTPPAARGINTFTSLWQALTQKNQGAAKIRKLLNVPSGVTMVNYVVKPIERVKRRTKQEKLLRRDAQHGTLMGVLKSLAARARKQKGVRAAAFRPQAVGDPPLQDEAISALAEALIARLKGVKRKQWTATDLTDPTQLADGLTRALGELQADPPAKSDFDIVVDAVSTLIGQLEETDASQPERFVALTKRAELQAQLVEEGRYQELSNLAHTFSTAILVISPGTIDPATGALTNAAAPALSGVAESAAVKVRVRVDAEPAGQDVGLDSLGQWSFTPAANLAEGAHTVTVQGVDAGDNLLTETATLAVTVDLTPPAPPTASSLQTADTTPVLSGSWDPAGGNSLSVAVGDTLYSVGAELVTTGGAWTLTIPTALPDGAYPVIVTVTDRAGNSRSVNVTLTVDTVAPGAPTVNAQLANTATPTVSGTWDAAPGNTLTVTVGGQSYNLGGGALSASGGAWLLAIPAAAPLADGQYTVVATGSDAAGNVGPSASDVLTIDTSSPNALTVVSQLTADTTPTVTGTWDPGASNENTISVTIDGHTYDLGSGITATGSSWSLAVTQALADGSYTVAATGSDPAGNTVTGAGTLVVDTTPPSTPTAAVLAVATTTPTLTGTCDTADTASITLLLNGKTYATTCAANAWTVTLPATDALFDASFPFTLTATDAVGNVSSPGNFALVVAGTAVRTPIITTVAGGGIGDGGPAINTSLYNPQAVAVDAQGNVYLADTAVRKVRRIAPDGTITSVAGNGEFTYNGDGVSAITAALWQPWALAVDGSGNLYIGDSGQSRVRRVDGASGIITTVAGNGQFCSSLPCGDGGAATSASLGAPSGLALDGAGNLYIADSYSNVVRKVDTAGIITRMAGGGTSGIVDGVLATDATLSGPAGLAVDSSSNLYISDYGHHLVRRVDATTGLISTVAGTGTAGYNADGIAANAAQLNFPDGLSFDGSGGLLIADHDNHRIRRIDGNGIITTVVGNGTAAFGGDGGNAAPANIALPNDVAAVGNTFYIADTGNNRIRKVDASNIITTIGGNGETTFGGDGRSALSAMIGFTTGLALDPVNGDVYLADSGNGRIRKLDSAGVITTVAGTGVSAYNGDGGLATLSALASPQGLAFDSVGNLFIADTYNQRIRRVDKASGNISTVAGDGVQCQSPQSPPCGDGIAATSASLNYPQAVALDSAGNLYIADGSNHVVRRVDTGGTITTVAGGGVPPVGIGDGGAAIAATLSSPNGVALDGNGNLFILDAGNSRIRRVDRASQIISTVAGGGSASPGDGGQATDAVLDQPTDITIDANGNLYIAEGYSEGGGNRVRKVDAAGIISTIAGNGGSPAFGGDGGPAIEASLHAVEAVAVDATGTVYIADSGNGRVRRVGDSKVALADTFTLDSSARLAGNDLSGLAVETSSVGYAAWTSVPATIDLLAGNATNGYVSTKTGASQPDCLGTLPLALANATATYSVSAKVFPEVIVGAGPTGSAGVGFFIANAETDLPLTTTVGTTALALLADGSGAWRMVTSATASTELLRGSVTSGNWSATAPPLLRLTWATARKTASASLDGVSLFENLDVSSIDSSQVKFVGFGCEGPLGAGALVDDFRVMELP